VWNGKEALEYLLAPHSKPDIILMDVQMPIIDGYKATHVIRHHAPYNLSSHHIPIVAMTASAIQGDREKCKKAGMDDYLAKPVKCKALEKMLVRWAISGRVPRTPVEGEYDGSHCSEPGEQNCSTAAIPIIGQGKPSAPSEASQQSLQTLRPAMSKRQNSHHLSLPGTESEGERAERREEAEEKATALRDEKLVGAAGTSRGARIPHGEKQAPGEKLTVENIGKLESEVTERSARKEFKRRNLSPTRESMVVERSTPERTPERGKSGERPRVERRWRDSERTITGV
jgi:CheY-like chemotaxis protein